ncbi:MAG TPA: putative Ig domain-containing protein [Bryobacteraceae bacterium]|nr:putative Ig domain-containing protein [Bryobacteraceae bacterium]
MAFPGKSAVLSPYSRFLFLKRIAIIIALGVPASAQLAVSISQPYATRGVAYTGQGIAGGGTLPYTFTITQGALPPGLQMDGTGAITGTPTHAGQYAFTISAVDSVNISGSGIASITVAGTSLTVSPVSIPQGYVGVAYAPITFSVSGGVPPYVLSATSLPPGMTFNPTTWVLSGTPTIGGSYSVDFLATDQAGDVGTSSSLLPVPDIIPATLTDGSIGTAYGAGFSAIGFAVTPTLSVSGTLPPGVLFSPNSGLLSGTPTVAGTFTFTAHATGGGLTASRIYSVIILNSPPLEIGGVPGGTVGVPYNQTIPIFYATPPLTVTLTSGTVPPGLTLSTSGVLSGTPTHAGQYGLTLSVVDSTGKTGTGSFLVSFVPPPLTVSPATIPGGTVGQPYSVTFSASGGEGNYRYNLALQVVPGLSLDSNTGVLSGTPTSGGVYNIRIDASDPASATGSQTYTLNITGPTPPFTLTPLTLPDGTAGKFYSWGVNASGSLLPVTFAVTGGTPPPGLVFTPIPNGITINHIPTTPGAYQFQITGTDSSKRSVSQNYSVNIASQAITVSPSSVPAAIATVPYSVNFSATGGTPPYTYAVFNADSQTPTAPGGLLLSTNGTLSGIPQGGTVTFTIQATDSKGMTGSWDYILAISQTTLIVTPLVLANGTLGQAYSTPMSANGGTAPYTFSLSSGVLPNGVTLSSSGVLAGSPQQAGMFNISITAIDALGAAGSRSYQFIVSGAAITLGPSTLPDAMVGQPYLVHLTATGGVAPYVFTKPVANLWVTGLQVASDGTISGTPITDAPALLDFNIVVTDANGSTGAREFFVNLRYGVLSLSPTALSSATVGTAYTATFSAFGGTPPYVFSVYPGTPLAEGLKLSTAGVLSGTPVYATDNFITIKAVDSTGAFGTQNYLIAIGPAVPPPPPPPPICTYDVSPGGAVFSSTGGVGTITITTTSNCSWTITNIPSWVTFTNAISGAGNGIVRFQVGQNSGSDVSAVLSVAGVSFSVEQQASSVPGMTLAGSMPHTASAENWTTTFTLVADGSSSTTARLSLFGDAIDPSGNGPLTLPLTFPQLTGASAPLPATSIDRTLAANASLIVNTAGPQVAPVLVGSAQLAATGALGGFAIFHQIVTEQEAVVPMETRNASSYLLSFDDTNGIVLGVAVANISAQAANIPVIIRDDTGAVIGPAGASISLTGNGHTSFVLSDPVLGFPVTANKRGTIEFDTPAGGRISVLGLRFTPPNNALTTIPALANIGTGGGSIAHLASGDGWQTTFVLVNTGTSAASATLNFFADQTGTPLTLPLSLPQSGDGTTMAVPSYTAQLAAGATSVIVSAGASQLLTGSAQLSTTGHVSGYVIFRHNDQEAVVPLESRNASAYVIAFDNTKGTATGIALNAVSMEQVSIPVTVRNDKGATIATDTITLATNGHYAFTLGTDKYPAAATIRGTIEFDTPPGAQIGALGIRIPAVAAHTYTTLPALAK